MSYVYDVIINRHTKLKPDIVIYYDEDPKLSIKVMGDYVRKNGFTVKEEGKTYSIATLVLRKRTPTGKIINEMMYHELFDTITGEGKKNAVELIEKAGGENDD